MPLISPQNGYGDFNFAPPGSLSRDRCSFYEPRSSYTWRAKQEPWHIWTLFGEEDPDPNRNEHNGQVVNFTLFLELPIEVRHLIYAQLIKPFQALDGTIQMELGKIHQGTIYPEDYHVIAYIELPAHPFRTYTLHIPNYVHDSWFTWHKHVTGLDYYTLWALSCTSHQVREEIGESFWPHVFLSVVTPIDTHHEETLLRDFFLDRPLAACRIKKFDLEINHTKSIESDLRLENLCNKLAKHLELERICLCFGPCGLSAKEMLVQNGDVPWVRAFRKIHARGLNFLLLDILPAHDDEEELVALAQELVNLAHGEDVILQEPHFSQGQLTKVEEAMERWMLSDFAASLGSISKKEYLDTR